MENRIQQAIRDSIRIKDEMASSSALISLVAKISEVCIQAIENGHRIFFCGNGGSAADAQHLAAELSGRYYYDRPPLYSEALNVNMSYVTAVGNDYGYDAIFERSLQAKGQRGDVLFGLSTSGNSPNVLKAFKYARAAGIITVAFTGQQGGALKDLADYRIGIPSSDTPRIQEAHMLVGHVICEQIESAIFPQNF